MIDCAFDTMNARKVFAETIDGVKSVNLMKKLGMKLQAIQSAQTEDALGKHANLYVYCVSSEDRQSHKFRFV